jgi:hypothetical protein
LQGNSDEQKANFTSRQMNETPFEKSKGFHVAKQAGA